MKLLAVFLLLFSIMEKYSLAHGDEQVHLFRRTVDCPSGWTAINGRCFSYVADVKNWAGAEKHCLSLGGNLASVHSQEDYHKVQDLIFSAVRLSKPAWIGGTDAQQENVWLWSDGTPMKYTNWCTGQPNNALGRQSCVQMNYSKKKCWDDMNCATKLPFVCVKRNSPPTEAEA